MKYYATLETTTVRALKACGVLHLQQIVLNVLGTSGSYVSANEAK
jgi:hypothetical protein